MKPDLRVVFKNNPHVRCVYHSLVVKMSSLEEKFKGGPSRFLEKHRTVCNRDLAVVNAMGTQDLWPIIEDLEKSGLIPREEAFLFDATSLGRFRRNGQKINTGIDWLTGHVDDFAVLVRLK